MGDCTELLTKLVGQLDHFDRLTERCLDMDPVSMAMALYGVDCHICGDGIMSGVEACDDGHANSDQPGAPCRTNCRRSRCGDLVVDPGEECDEGDDASGATCDSSCRNPALRAWCQETPSTMADGMATDDCGVCCNDANAGQGFIMYSEESVHQRAGFDALDQNYENFICVRFQDGQWEQDSNNAWKAFTPESTDVLLASVDFGADSVTSLQGQVDMYNNMRRGYDAGDLEFSANDRIGAGGHNGGSNEGEFWIDGTFFKRSCGDAGEECVSSVPSMTISTSDCGVCCNDDSAGQGFIMYSEESVHQRAGFSVYTANYENFVCVRFQDGQWEQDSNNAWAAFTPETTDVLVASVDFGADSVTSLQGQVDMYNNMRRGYDTGDLEFSANDRIGAGGFDGGSNVGEFWIDGTSFSRACDDARCEVVTIGPNDNSSPKAATLDARYICPSPINIDNRVNEDHPGSGDWFTVGQSGDTVTATRGDSPGNGWGMNLQFECCY
jgi:hypothetical protein